MQTMEKQVSPHAWDSGPPESKIEGWNYERRTELLSLSKGVLEAQIMGAMRNREEWQSDDGELGGVDPKRAVELAKRLIAEVEKVHPKL